MTARILGVDPGFASIGWAIVDTMPDPTVATTGEPVLVDVGVFTSKPDRQKGRLVCQDNHARARAAARCLAAVIREHRPDVVMAEGPAGAQGFKAAFGIGAGQGILGTLTELLDLPCDVCTPQAIKAIVGGAANASKEDVAHGVEARIPAAGPMIRERILKTSWEHAFDAVAAVLVGFEQSELVRLARRRTA